MTRVDGDLFVPTVLRSILTIFSKSLRQKLIGEGDFISIGMSFQHLAPK